MAESPHQEVITLTLPPDQGAGPAAPPPEPTPSSTPAVPSGPLAPEHGRALAALLEPGRSVLVWGGDAARQLAPLLPPNVSLTTIDQNQRLADDEPLVKYVHAASGGRFDLIVIAGRARAACLHHAPSLLAQDGAVALLAPPDPRFDEPKSLYAEIAHIGPVQAAAEHLWIGARTSDALNAERARQGALPLIVSCFTTATPYEEMAARLVASCDQLGLEHDVRPIEPRGSWEANCAAKATFLRDIHREARRPILWVDADAEVRQAPALLTAAPWDVAIHKWRRRKLASGTIYFGAGESAARLLEAWAERCEREPRVWDQHHLALAWLEVSARAPLATRWLPASYCAFDHPETRPVDQPVILHHQASRAHKTDVSTSEPAPEPTFTPQEAAALRFSRPITATHAAPIIEAAPMASPPADPAGGEGEAPDDEAERAWHDEDRALVRTLRARLLDAVAARLASEGKRRIALFGAGRHTRPIVRQPWGWRGLEVVAILDDDPKVDALDGVPVLKPAALDTLPAAPDAIVISSQYHEQTLYDSARDSLGASGIPIERLYADQGLDMPLASLALRLIEDHAVSKDDAWWLLENRAERHDATLPILPPARTELHLRRYQFAASCAENVRALDAACGTGYGSAMLARAGATRVIGVDADERTIQYAERRHGLERVSFLQQDATSLAFEPGSFDLIVSFETVEHVEDPSALIAGFARALENDGRLIISTPNNQGLTTHHLHSFTRQSFQDLLLERFAELEWIGQVAGDEPAQEDLPPGIFSNPSSPDPALPEPQYFIVIASRPRR